jgi:hypothetical protein
MLVRAEPRWQDPDGTRRLRAMLKSMLRAWGVRCITFQPLTSEDVAASDAGEEKIDLGNQKGGGE